MQEILKQLFGDAVTEEALKTFNAELGKKFVAKTDFNSKLEKIKTLEGDKKALEDKITQIAEDSKNSEDYKEKFENLQKEIKEKEEKAEADRKAQEKVDNIKGRFDTAVGDKKFSHDAIRESYLKKFSEALDDKDYQGKSDADILHSLIKDDAAAFEGVRAFHLEGGTNGSFDTSKTDLGKLDMAEYIAARKEMKG